MAELGFENLSFRELGERIEVNFLKLFYFYLEKHELKKIADFRIKNNGIIFKNLDKEKAKISFDRLLAKGFSGLKNRISNKDTIYIHQYSGIPLIGHIAFGIVDKDLSLIELKPITGCNLSCTFCSVDMSKRVCDFVVEKDYLVQETKKLVEFKGINGVEVNINPHGEPTLYAELVNLVKDLSKIRQIKTISMNTNAIMLNKKLVDSLVDAGFSRFNVSLSALEQDMAKSMAGNKGYDVKKVVEICKYINKKSSMLIAPVWVHGLNDEEIPKLIELANELDAPIRIQNFQLHKLGKKPVKKEKPWPGFFEELKKMEKEYGVRLTGEFKGFRLKKTRPSPKPFRKNDIIKAEIKCPGEFPNEVIAVSDNRAISVFDCNKKSGKVRLKILRDKYNIYTAKVV